MGSVWPMVWACLCIFVAIGQSAVLPTNTNDDAFVIAKVYNSDPKTIEEAMQQATTESPLPGVKVMELQVNCVVSMRYAHTAVVSLVKNPAKKAQQTTFSVILPQTAFITGFSMTIAGKTYKAYVKEKEEAKKIYDDAVSQGLGAAHVATKARDSNHFTVDVNIEPLSSIVFNLTYEELLVRHNGLYQINTNINPGNLVPKLNVTVHIIESQKIKTLRVPEIKTGNEIIPTESDAQNTKAVITRAADDREAKITFSPDIDLQKKLMDIYVQKSKESEANSHRQIYLDDDDQSEPEGNIGQFVVQYDVDREVGSEILVNDGYFVHFFAPRSLSPLPKFCIFVLDTSGSMSGRKITQLREAMQTILGDLHAEDYFALIEFASGVKVHDLDEADKPEPTKPTHYVFYERDQSPKLVPPFKATPENIAKAKTLVSRMNAVGGTNIAGALNAAIDLIQKGISWKPDPTKEIVAEQVTQTESTTTETTETHKTSRAIKPEPKPENDTIKQELNSHQPIIIFLTDGEPTVGETNPKRIASNVFEKNIGDLAATMFSLAFGNGADGIFLRRLALQNRGFMRQIYEGADSALQIHDFYKQISSPLAANVTFLYPSNQVKKTTKTKFRTYFEGSEIVVAGRVDNSLTELTSEVSGFCGVDDRLGRKRYEVRSKGGIVPKKDKDNNNEFLPLERIWAYLTVKQLLEERDAAEEQDKPKEEKEKPEKEALELALKYEFVTDLTSLVVVKPNDTKTVNAESADGISSAPNFVSGASQLSTANFAPSAFKADFSSAIGQVQSDPFILQQQIVPESLYESEDDIDGVDYDVDVRPSTTSTTTIAPVQPTEPPKTLATYHLEQYPWIQSLLDFSTDELKLDVNGVSTSLKLTKDSSVPQSSSPCSRATNGAAGLCVYLTRCDAARNISVDLYKSTFCSIDGTNGQTYAGVCCPKASESETKTEDKQCESECDAESNEQMDSIDDDQSQKDDETTKGDTENNSSSSETQNDETGITPESDTSKDDDSNVNDGYTIKKESVGDTESTDDDSESNDYCDNLDQDEAVEN